MPSNPFFTHADGWPAQGSRGVSPPARSDMDQVAAGFDIAFMSLVDVGTVNQIVVTPPASLLALTDGLKFNIKVLNSNTGATTVTLGSLGTITAKYPDGTSLLTGALIAGQWAGFTYNSSTNTLQYVSNALVVAGTGLPTTGGNMTGPINEFEGANIASAATINLTGATGNVLHVTGSVTITAITLQQGAERTVIFDGAPLLTHSSTLLLSNAAQNIQVAANDVAIFRGDAGGVTRLVAFIKASGQAVAATNKNFIRNGSMEIAQLATTYALTTSVAYGSTDGFSFVMASSAAGIANQITTAASPAGALAGFKNCLKIGRNNGSALTNRIRMFQILESIDSYEMQGKNVCLSFRAHAGANFSAPSLNVVIAYGSGTDETGANLNTAAWTSVNGTGNTQVVTASWARYQFNKVISSSATQVGMYIDFTPAGTAGADDNLYITDIRLEIADVATDAKPRLYQQELAICRRVLRKQAVSVAASPAQTCFPIEMRAIPSISGGGAGFASTGTTADTLICTQTAIATQTLILDAQL